MTKTIRHFWVAAALGLASLTAWPQTWVKLPFDTGAGTPVQQVEGVLRKPAGTPNGHALLILHHGGGFSFNTTQQYGEFFAQRGFVTLELKMFDVTSAAPPPLVLRGHMMGGLKYLAQMPGIQQVSAMGMSLGSFLTIDATSSWFYNHYQAGDLRFHKLVALYPVCWFYSEAVQGKAADIRIFTGMPPDHLQRLEGIPLLILAAGRDSYDALDANACPDFVKRIPDPKQAERTQVVVYPEATHAWDHGRNYSFPVRGGCKGRSDCTNHIISSPDTVEKGKQATLGFLLEK